MLKHQIQTDATQALKEGNHEVASILRMSLAAITSKEKEKRYKISKDLPAQAGSPTLTEDELVKKSELTDDEIIGVLSSEIKKRKDAILLYEKGNRPELAENEKKEIDIIKTYLPEQLSSEEIQKLVQQSIEKVGAQEMKDMGKVMADLNPSIKGKADSSEVSKIVKNLLQK